MKNENGKKGRGAATCIGTALGGLLILTSLLSGCSMGRRTASQPVEDNSVPVAAGVATLTRFQGEREGFRISEQTDMTGKLRTAFDQAVAMLEGEQYAEAISLLKLVIDSSPGVTAPYIDMAIAYRHVGKPEQAEDQLKKALELVPGHPVASNEYGLLLRKDGRFVEARTVYEQALQQFPEYFPVRKNLGILCELYLADRACALEQYRLYSEVRPEDEEVRLWIADLNLRRGVKQP